MKAMLLACCAAAMLSLESRAAIHTIQVGDFQFSPKTMTINLGDTVRWLWTDGSHTTTSSAVPTGAAVWDRPISSSSPTYLYVPALAGTYAYVCTPHASMGMVGSFTVVANPSNVPGVPVSSGLQIAPNPVRGAQLLLHLEASGQVDIRDASGKLLYQKMLKAGDQSVPTTGWPAGMYFIRQESVGGILTRRFQILE